MLDRDPARARHALAQIRQTGQEAIGELSTLVGLIPEDTPTSADPQPTLADIERLVESTRAAGLDIHVDTQGPARPLPAAVELNAYRVIQEGLTNALKHAGHARVNVVLRCHPSNLEVEVLDDGAQHNVEAGAGTGSPGSGSGWQRKGAKLGAPKPVNVLSRAVTHLPAPGPSVKEWIRGNSALGKASSRPLDGWIIGGDR